MRGNSILWMGLGVIAIMGCGNRDHSGSASSDSSLSADNPQPTYAWIEKNIIQAKCVECHQAGNAKGSIELDGGYQQLKDLVRPGDPDSSEIIVAIETLGMPKKRAPLPPAHKAALRQWIADGAKNQ